MGVFAVLFPVFGLLTEDPDVTPLGVGLYLKATLFGLLLTFGPLLLWRLYRDRTRSDP